MFITLCVIPILVLIVLLGIFKVPAHLSSLISLVICLVLAMGKFHFSINDFYQSVAYGSIKALGLIILIVIMAIYSYNILLHTKYMEVLKQQIASISKDKTIQVLLITFGFGGLLESLAGFGTSVAIPMAILISLGYKSFFSAMVSLIANSAITAFGSIGLVVVTLSQETKIATNILGTTIIIQLAILMVVTIFIVTMLTNKKQFWKNLFLSLLLGGVSSVVQYFSLCFLGIEMPGIISCVCILVILIVVAKYQKKTHKGSYHVTKPPLKKTLKAWSIYILIVVFIIISNQFRPWLDQYGFSQFSFMIGDKHAIFEMAWFTSVCFLLFLGSIIGGAIQGAHLRDLLIVLWKTVIQLRKTIFTILFLVIFATIMDFSGMLKILAIGIAEFTGKYFAFVAPIIGCLGTFLTGSNAASNILFGKLQYSVAHHLHLDTTWISASNTSGATMGKIISPQSISIATSTCNIRARYESKFFKAVILYAMICLVLLSIIIFIGSLVL